MQFHHILWDWNGTLIDDVHTALNCVNDMLSRKGRQPITLGQYYTYVETPIIGFYRHILPPEELDFPEISAGFHRDYLRRLSETQLAEGAKELLKEQKENGVRQYIVTATHTLEATSLAERYGVSGYFDGIFGAENNFAESKTLRAKQFFEARGIDPNDAVFIGDSLHDLETANALGIAAILVSYGHQGKAILEESGAVVCDSLAEVGALLRDERIIDLHTHSDCSDGTLSPAALVTHAKSAGLSTIALTDHDTLSGIPEARAQAKTEGIELIPGVEFSCAGEKQLHLLGLYLDETNPQLCAFLDEMRAGRERHERRVCERLTALGLPVTYEEALQYSRCDFVGRSHIAQVMVKKGYVRSIRDAFEGYIGSGGKAYVPKTEPRPEEAIAVIHASGGVAVLAHLNQMHLEEAELRDMLARLKKAGLDGIEGYYTEYTPAQSSFYRSLAAEYGLLLSGGSDFHAGTKPHIAIGTGTGKLHIPSLLLLPLRSRAAQIALKNG